MGWILLEILLEALVNQQQTVIRTVFKSYPRSVEFFVKLQLVPITWIFHFISFSLNLVNTVTKGKVDEFYPLARYDISVITRSVFKPYFDSNYDPDNVLFVGDSWIF